MSRMMRSDRKPPLPRSPIRLRPRRNLQSATNIPQPPQTLAGYVTKTQLPKRTWDSEELELRPEYRTISCELKALAKLVENGFKDTEMEDSRIEAPKRSPLFERGRFYEEYSARRNERLKRKNGGLRGEEKKPVYDLGVRVGSSAKKTETKKVGSSRKLVPPKPVMERLEGSRYSLRNSSRKENNKPPPPLLVSFEKSVGGTERKMGGRRTRKM